MLIQARQVHLALKSFRSSCDSELLTLTGMELRKDARRGLFRTIAVETLTRRGKFVGLTPRKASGLTATVQELWCAVSLIGIDDDYDENSRSRDYIIHRLARVYCIIEFSFGQARGVKKTQEAATQYDSVNDGLEGFVQHAEELERVISIYRAILAEKRCSGADALAAMWLSGSKTYAEGANLIGGAKFGLALSKLEVLCHDAQFGQEHLDDYVQAVFFWLKQSAIGQILSHDLPQQIDSISLRHYWQVCKLKTGCLAKICSLPRLFHIYDDMVHFYEVCDPGYLQLFLDDIFDIDADTRHGIPNIFHLLILRQGRLAQVSLGVSENAEFGEDELYDKEIVSNGILQGSLVKPSRGHGGLVYSDLKNSICNHRTDHSTAPNEMRRVAILRGRRMEQCLLNRDVSEAKKVMRDAGVYSKFVELFHRDQRFVADSAPRSVKAKALWLPYLLRVYVALVRATHRVVPSLNG